MSEKEASTQLLNLLKQFFKKHEENIKSASKRVSFSLIVIACGVYIIRKKSESVRIYLDKFHRNNITWLIQFKLYSIRFHLPLILNDLFILFQIISNTSKINNKNKNNTKLQITINKFLFKLIILSLLNILFCYLFNLIRSILYPINGIKLFEKIVQKPIDSKLLKHITDIDNLLDKRLEYIPYLKNEIWTFLIDNDEIDLNSNIIINNNHNNNNNNISDSSQMQRRNIIAKRLSITKNKRFYQKSIHTKQLLFKRINKQEKEKEKETIRGVNMKEFLIAQRYILELKFWIKKKRKII